MCLCGGRTKAAEVVACIKTGRLVTLYDKLCISENLLGNLSIVMDLAAAVHRSETSFSGKLRYSIRIDLYQSFALRLATKVNDSTLPEV